MSNLSTSETAPVQEQALASQLREQIMGFRTTQIIATAASLDIAGYLKKGPHSAAQLAETTNTNAESLLRLLRALTSLGIVTVKPDGTFTLTTVGYQLCDDTPGSLRNVAILYGEPWLWQAYAQLKHSVENNAPAFDFVHGCGLYDYLKQNPSAAKKFNKAMSDFSLQEAEAIKKAYDFSIATNIVDVGGGEGHLVLSLLEAYPSLSGVVFDLPNVAHDESIHGRLSHVSGDFFQEVYGGGDLYILKSVLHNWDNASCVAILENCYKAMAPTTRLLIMERVIPTEGNKSEAVLFDINMLVVTEGRERTETEYKWLAESSGFMLDRIIPTESTLSIVECIRKV